MLMQSARYPEQYETALAAADDLHADRAAAGRALATLLLPYRGGRAIVLALSPGAYRWLIDGLMLCSGLSLL